MKQKLIILLLMLACQTTLFARDFEVQVGRNLAALSSYENVSGKTGFRLGFTIDLPINRLMYTQTGLLFNQKGAKESIFYSKIGNVRANYLEVPLQLSFRFPMGKVLKYRINLGSYAALGLYGKGEIRNSQTNILIEKNTFTSIVDSRFDYGASFDTGIEVKRMYFGLGYSYGFGAGNNSVLNFTFGYKLPTSFFFGKETE